MTYTKEVLEKNIYLYSNLLEDPTLLIKEIEDLDKKLSNSDAMTKWKHWASSDEKRVYGKTKTMHHPDMTIDNENNNEVYKIF
jgi:hypothetical protein